MEPGAANPTASAPSPAIAQAHPWMRWLLRMGFVARGTLYALIGLLTLWSVWRNGEKARGGMSSTLSSLHALGPGVVLLSGLALGFAGFAAGMIWEAIFDWNLEGKTTLGWARRLAAFINGLAHLSLMASAILLIVGHQPEGHGTRRWTERAIRYPFGRELVVISGLSAVGYGIFLLSKIVTGRLDRQLDLSRMPRAARFIASWVGRFGMLSRGVIYITIGLVLAVAGFRGDASGVVGLGGAMKKASDHPYGEVSLALIAAGLVAYGLLMYVEAGYRRAGDGGPAPSSDPP